ncbi:MAG TPA: UDP-N-acetylmuramate dehydrogenase [Longimicrobiales bacterium]
MSSAVSTSVARELAARLGLDRIERDVPLAPMTTFRIGGPADYLYRARNARELEAALRTARELELPVFLLGSGANILVGDRGFRGLVIRNESTGVDFLDDTRVRAESGVLIYHDLINATVARGLGGLHHFVGIPSTVGGAIWQNLHFLSPAPARERTVFIEEVVESCTLLTEENQVRTVGLEYLEFGYDYSILHGRDDVVLDVVFRLQPAPRDDLRRVMMENLAWRDEKHPDLWLYPCAGSVFKKIEGVGAGRLIDQCGLKGHVHGNAQIFHKHANIIVNIGGATAADVRALIELAQETVQRELGYQLETEIGMIGEF